jgi:hypothetical protein
MYPDDFQDVRIQRNLLNNLHTNLRRHSGNGCLRQDGMREKLPLRDFPAREKNPRDG